MRPACSRVCLATLVGAVFFLPCMPAFAGSHLWRFNEVFTNADGTVQFVELKECCGADSEIFLAAKWVESGATGKRYTFPADLTGDTSNKYLLLGTSGFAALPGAPTPDYIMPDNFLGFNGDTLEYWFYPDAIMIYGIGALPSDGVTSLRIDGTTGVNSPTNFAGASGSVIAGPCVDNDGDEYGSPGNAACPGGPQTDCDDANMAINPAATELCTDDVDNDCDGLTDCDDPPCASVIPCIPTLSEWGMLSMTLLLLSNGSVMVARRRTAHG